MKERIKELEEQLEQTNNRLMETCITWVECPGFMIHPEHRCGKCLSCVTAQRDEWKARYKGTHVPPDQKKSFAEMYDESFTKLMVTKSDLNDARQATTKAKRELADYIDESGALYRRTRDRAEQAEAERDEARQRNRQAAQHMISRIGAPGPETVIETTRRMVEKYDEARAEVEHLRAREEGGCTTEGDIRRVLGVAKEITDLRKENERLREQIEEARSQIPHPGDGSCRLCGEAPADPHGICDTCRSLPAELERYKAAWDCDGGVHGPWCREWKRMEDELSSMHERGKAAWEKTAAERDSWADRYHGEANEVVRLKLAIHNLLKDNTLKDFARSETERAESNGERASYFEVENMKLSAEIKEWKEKAQMFNKVGMDMQSEAVGAQLECCSLRNDVGRLEREHAMLRGRSNTAEARRVEAEVERDDALTKLKKAE